MRTFFKEVDAKSFLDFKSNNLKQWKINMPYGQMVWVKHHCSKPLDCEHQMDLLAKRLNEKNYPKKVVEDAKDRALKLNRVECLTKNSGKSGAGGEDYNLYFVTKYSNQAGEIKRILKKN